MANILTIKFNGCPPAQNATYKVLYRRNPTEGYTAYPGTFVSSPILISIAGDPPTQQYEGYLEVYCNGIAGAQVPFRTPTAAGVPPTTIPGPPPTTTIPRVTTVPPPPTTTIPGVTTIPAPISVPFCAPLYSAFYDYTGLKGYNIYYYERQGHKATRLPVPLTGDGVTGLGDIAHGVGNLWITDIPNRRFIEYNINLSPFSAVFSKFVPFPAGLSPQGLHALNASELLTVNGAVSPKQVVVLDLLTGTLTTKFALPAGRDCRDLQLVGGNKHLIAITKEGANNYITQYNYTTGVVEVDIRIYFTTPITTFQADIFGTKSICFMDSNDGVVQIEKTPPYGLVGLGRPNNGHLNDVYNGSSQVHGDCLTEFFTP